MNKVVFEITRGEYQRNRERFFVGGTFNLYLRVASKGVSGSDFSIGFTIISIRNGGECIVLECVQEPLDFLEDGDVRFSVQAGR